MQAADVIAHGEVPRSREEALDQYVHVSCITVSASVLYQSISDVLTVALDRLGISPQCGFASHSRGFAFITHEVCDSIWLGCSSPTYPLNSINSVTVLTGRRQETCARQGHGAASVGSRLRSWKVL